MAPLVKILDNWFLNEFVETQNLREQRLTA